MDKVSVFQYQSAIEFLKDAINAKKKSDESFSIRKFCKQTNFGSHAYLVMILRGRRQLTHRQILPLAEGLGLTSIERLYFQTLIQLDSAGTDEERNLVKLWLSELNPKPGAKTLEVERYHVIADWIHMAILAIAKAGAPVTAENVWELTRRKVPLAQVSQAITRLIDLEMLVLKDGNLVPTFESVRTKDDVSIKGLREYHQQVSKLAMESLEEQDSTIREFQAFALTIPKGKIPLAKDMIRKFRHQLTQVMEAEPAHEVYQCNLQFFKLADSQETLNHFAGNTQKTEILSKPRSFESGTEVTV